MNRFLNNGLRLAALVGTAAGCAALAAGTAPETASPGPPPLEACKLLTAAQISAAYGIKMDAGSRPIANEPRMCNWREATKPNGRARNLLLTVISPNEFEDLQKLPQSAPAPGIGDAAFFTRSLRVPVILTVKSGSHYFRLLVRSDLEASDTVDERNQAIETTLAAQVMKNL